MLIKQITSPINSTVVVLKDLAEGEGDLTKRVAIQSRDEIRVMASYLNQTLEKIRHLVGTIKLQPESLSELETFSRPA